jgi:hypothetical protein
LPSRCPLDEDEIVWYASADDVPEGGGLIHKQVSDGRAAHSEGSGSCVAADVLTRASAALLKRRVKER